jgi:hypothetical protein
VEGEEREEFEKGSEREVREGEERERGKGRERREREDCLVMLGEQFVFAG